MRLKKEKNTRGFTDENDRVGGKMSKDIKITWGSSGKDISPQEGSVRVGTSGKPISEGASLITSYSTAGKHLIQLLERFLHPALLIKMELNAMHVDCVW